MAAVSDFALAGDFPAASREQWRALVSAVLARSGVTDVDPEVALSSPTYEGIELRPLYTAADAPAGLDSGRVPTADGPAADIAGGIGWDVRAHHRDVDPGALNRAVLADLNNGVTSVWLELGDGALDVADLPDALDGVYLDLAPIVLDAGSHGDAAARELLRLADDRGVNRAELAGSFGLDPIAAYARTGAAIDLDALVATAALSRECPRLVPITVDGTVYHDAGGNDADELAIATAVGLTYLRALTDAGWPMAEAFAAVEFRFAVTVDQFASTAKLRAARRIWARVGELCGLEVSLRGQRQHAVTSRAMLTRRDPWVNLLRGTLACFAAATAGADAITVEPFDSAIGYPDDFGRRIARNTQSILHDESSLGRVRDPAGGSWYVESRTDQLAHSAWQQFTAIERLGGMPAALDHGHVIGFLGATQGERAAAIARRRDPITGVSEFAFLAEEPVSRVPYPARPFTGLLWPHRWAESFEWFRDLADAAPVRPKVFLAALGSNAAHSARVGFARNLYNSGGVETIGASGAIDEIVDAFRAAGTPVACLCSSDRVYAEDAATAAAALVAAGATQVWLAGQPGERAATDAAAGIDGYLFSGVDAIDVLHRTFAALGLT